MDCPITCPCRRSAAGAFVLALCAWAAAWSPTYLGGNFAAMVANLVFAPHVVAPELIGWALTVGVGLWLSLSGIRPAIAEGDSAQSWAVSLAAIAGGGAALGLGWHLPGGPFWSLTGNGLFVGAIAAGVANVSLSLAARGYEAGYIAALVRRGSDYAPRFDRGEREEAHALIAALTAECERLAADLARVGPPARDLQDVLQFPGVRKAVLKVLHRDAHPGVDEQEARTFDERFKKASAVFEQLAIRP